MIPADWLPGLPVALSLLVAAILVGGAPIIHDRLAHAIAILAAIATFVLCGALLVQASHGTIVYWFGGWQPRDGVALGIAFTIDRAAAGMATFTSFLVMSTLIYAASYFRAIGTLFHGLMLVFVAAMIGFCLTGDLFNLFVFFELMSVVAYALTAYKVEERGPIQGALNFAISNSLGAFLVLFGIGLLYGRTGALNLAQIGRQLGSQPRDELILVALGLIAVGLCVKAAIVPFHFWLADAHAVAPTPVCVLFSGVMVELGLYGLVRIYFTVFADITRPHAAEVRLVWVVAGALTALVGGLMCYLQRHLKRMLAFSTVSHAGAFLLGVASLSATGLAGSMLYVIGHGLVKAALFMVTGVVLDRFGSVDEIELRGQARPLPLGALIFGLGGLALAGAPLFVSTTGKSLVEEAFDGATGLAAIGVLLISSVLTGAAIVRATLRVFFGFGANARDVAARAPTHGEEEREGREEERRSGPPWGMLLPAAVLMVLAVVLTVVPGPLGTIEGVAHDVMDQQTYAAQVLDGRAISPTLPESDAGPSARGLVLGALSCIGAVGVACVALGILRAPAAVARSTERVLQSLASPMRRIHSGHVGDYAAWLLLGTLAFGLAYTIALR